MDSVDKKLRQRDYQGAAYELIHPTEYLITGENPWSSEGSLGLTAQETRNYARSIDKRLNLIERGHRGNIEKML